MKYLIRIRNSPSKRTSDRRRITVEFQRWMTFVSQQKIEIVYSSYSSYSNSSSQITLGLLDLVFTSENLTPVLTSVYCLLAGFFYRYSDLCNLKHRQPKKGFYEKKESYPRYFAATRFVSLEIGDVVKERFPADFCRLPC